MMDARSLRTDSKSARCWERVVADGCAGREEEEEKMQPRAAPSSMAWAPPWPWSVGGVR